MTSAVAPTGIGGRAAEWLGYQLAVRPRLRRVTLVWLCGHLLTTWAVITAPRAVAAPAITILGFTGLTDSRGVPVSYYYLSTVSTAEKIRETGPGLSLNPDSWVEWLSDSLVTGLTYEGVAAALQMQAALYVTMVALALWALNFVLSLQWLTFLASWFRPLFDALQNLVADLYLFPICLAIGLAVGAFHVVVNNHKGHGWRVILSTVVIGILGFIVTRDPVSDLGTEHGLLAQARRAGLDVSSAAIGNAPIAPGTADPLRALSTSLVDAMIRAPLQLFNFGTSIDGPQFPGCGPAWDSAITSVRRSADGPARAMETCGAAEQLAYAQQLDGSSLGVGLFFLLFGAAFTAFIAYVTYSYFMVAGAAFINAIWLLFAAPLAMIDGAPRQRAWRRFTEFFRHAVLVFAYVLYLSFAAVIVKQISAPGGYAEKAGMDSPFAKLILTALVSVAAIGIFAWLKKQLGDQVRQNLVAKVRSTAAAGRAGMERGQRHNARAGATVAAAKAAGAPPGPEGDSPDGAALTGQPSPGRNSTSGSRSAGRSARIYRAAKAGVATAAAPEAVATKAAAGVATKAAAGAANRARPGSTPPAPATQGATSPATPSTRSAGAGIARAAGYTAAAVVPPSVARAAGYVTGLAGGSRAVTATKDRLRNGKSPAPTGRVDENDVADALNAQTTSATTSPQPGPPRPGTNPDAHGSEPTQGRSG
ncbi:hypothetical protein MCEMIE22_03138 [Mycobacteriaceae bacterium]